MITTESSENTQNTTQADGSAGQAQDGRTTSLADLLAMENLTEQVRRLGWSETSPFADDSASAAIFDGLSRALHRSSPRHVLLVRERGVGERAALIELAARGVQGCPPYLKNIHLLLANCRHLPLEATRPVVETLFLQMGHREDLVLCVDCFSALLRAQAGSDTRAAVLSHLARARCRIIGLLTPHEYEEHFLDDAETHDLFNIVQMDEPSAAVALELTRRYAAGLQQHYGVQIEDQAIERAVALSSSYILHDRLPHKAIKVLQALCDDVAYERSELGLARERIGEADVVAKVAQLSGIPAHTLSGIGESVDYRTGLGELVLGQEHAINEVATELGLIKAGMADPGKPASVLLFIGQTGTGKTELAKALARFYSPSKRLKTFTLGNFSEPHSVSGIIGVPPGYVGHEKGGRLVNELNADPYSVFLLDEADKAHPDVMQPFLNLFDEGWVYDQRGVKAYADRAIFILTTNVGQRQIGEMCKNGKSIEEITTTMKEQLSRIRHTKSNRPVFTPEFLARIKRVIVFRSLDQAAMTGICRKLVQQMVSDWTAKRQKTLEVPDTLVEAIAVVAHQLNERSQGKEGGRIVRKLLADLIEAPVQNAISQAPQLYRTCHRVVLKFQTNGTAPLTPGVPETSKTPVPSISPKDIQVELVERQDDKTNADLNSGADGRQAEIVATAT